MGLSGRPVSPSVALIGVNLGNRFNIRCRHGRVVPASDKVLRGEMMESQCLGWDLANNVVGVGDTEGGIGRLLGDVLHQLHIPDPRLAVVDLVTTVSIWSKEEDNGKIYQLDGIAGLAEDGRPDSSQCSAVAVSREDKREVRVAFLGFLHLRSDVLRYRVPRFQEATVDLASLADVGEIDQGEVEVR